MKKMVIKTISAVLAVLLVLPSFAFASGSAKKADSVTRVVCTVYGDGKTGRGFNWFTLEDGDSTLKIVKASEYDGSFENAKTYSGKAEEYRDRWSHKVTVPDLEPGEEYVYTVGDRNKNIWSEPARFVTDDGDSSFSFITIADVQASSEENFRQAALTLKGAIETAPDAEFYVNLGDYVNDNTNDEWDWYFNEFAFANNSMTHVPVAGNHDGNITNKLNTYCFSRTFNVDRSATRSMEGVYYSFDYGDAHFAVLNTNDMYPMSQAQRNWLFTDMNASSAKWKIVLAHRSCYSAGKNINKPDTVIMREVLIPLFDELDIDMVYAGHDHMYMRTGQLYGDKAVSDTQYVTEYYNGEELTFALNPEGTVYTLPSTAGTKRYAVNEDALKPINELAEVSFSTRDRGGCFAVTEFDGDYMVYKAYLVDDETQEISLVDTYAIKKTTQGKATNEERDYGLTTNFIFAPLNFFVAFSGMLVRYIKMLFDVIAA